MEDYNDRQLNNYMATQEERERNEGTDDLGDEPTLPGEDDELDNE